MPVDNIVFTGLSTSEFMNVSAYLEGGFLSYPKCREVMKSIPGCTLMKGNVSFYVLPAQNAWDYFSNEYKQSLEAKGISHIAELRFRAYDYWFCYYQRLNCNDDLEQDGGGTP